MKFHLKNDSPAGWHTTVEADHEVDVAVAAIRLDVTMENVVKATITLFDREASEIAGEAVYITTRWLATAFDISLTCSELIGDDEPE